MTIKLSDSADTGHEVFVFTSVIAVLAKKSFDATKQQGDIFRPLLGVLGHGSQKILKI